MASEGLGCFFFAGALSIGISFFLCLFLLFFMWCIYIIPVSSSPYFEVASTFFGFISLWPVTLFFSLVVIGCPLLFQVQLSWHMFILFVFTTPPLSKVFLASLISIFRKLYCNKDVWVCHFV